MEVGRKSRNREGGNYNQDICEVNQSIFNKSGMKGE